MGKLITILLIFISSNIFGQKTIPIILSGSGGGGGGNNIYNIDSSLSSDRTVDLNGKFLKFSQGGNDFLTLDPTAGSEIASLKAVNTTGGGNQGSIILQSENADAIFTLQSQFNGGAKLATIEGITDATTSTIDYTAATQTITVPTLFHITPDGVNDLLKVNPITFSSMIQGYDGTAESQIETSADLVGNAVFISLISNDGATSQENINLDPLTHQTSITSTNDAQVSSITLGSDSLAFNNEVNILSQDGNGNYSGIRILQGGNIIGQSTQGTGLRNQNSVGSQELVIGTNGSTDSTMSLSVTGTSAIGGIYNFIITPHFAYFQNTHGSSDSITKLLIKNVDSINTIDYNNVAFFQGVGDTLKKGHMPSILLGSATLNFGSTAAGTSTDLTITVTGVVSGDVVAVGVPNGSTLANGVFSCWISAADTVTVRFSNTNLVTALDPASGTFKVKVIKD